MTDLKQKLSLQALNDNKSLANPYTLPIEAEASPKLNIPMYLGWYLDSYIEKLRKGFWKMLKQGFTWVKVK